jgi:RNA polymerase sigma factor (sigma-70 family)
MGESFTEQNFDDQWHCFKTGDRGAFAAIYQAHVKSLLSYGYKVTSDRSLIEDSIQDLFVELWQRRNRISETTSVKYYLFQALRYKINRNRKANERVEFRDIEEAGEILNYSSHESFLISLEVQSLQMRHLRDIISKLPQRQQEAINLRYFNNFSNEEVAGIMGVNYQSACKFIYTALRELKLNLQISVS